MYFLAISTPTKNSTIRNLSFPLLLVTLCHPSYKEFGLFRGFDGRSFVIMLYHASSLAMLILLIVLLFWSKQTPPFSIVSPLKE